MQQLETRVKPLPRTPILAVSLLVSVTARSHGQERRSADGVRRAVVVARAKTIPSWDTTRISPDQASLWKTFVSCRRSGMDSVCSLIDGKPATAIVVRIFAPDSATVLVVQYFMSEHGDCPFTRLRQALKVSAIEAEEIWAYADGSWVYARRPVQTQC